MNKKKLIIIPAAILAVLAVGIAVFAVVNSRASTKVDGLYPYSYKVKDNVVTVKIDGKDTWEQTAAETDALTVTKVRDREFEIAVTDFFAGEVTFLHMTDDNSYDYFLGVNVIFDNDQMSVTPGSSGKATSETLLGEDTDMPVKVTSDDAAKAEVLFPGTPAGYWETEAPENVSVSGSVHDTDGTHFVVTATGEGEFTVIFRDKLNGKECAVTMYADAQLYISAVSAEVGTCEKFVMEKEEKEPKEDEPAEEG